MATKKYERIAGSEDTLILKEALERLSEGSLSSSLEGKVDMLLNELREARVQRERELEVIRESVKDNVDIEAVINRVASIPRETLDVEGLVEKIYNLTNQRPTYKFEVERNHSGVLVGITATPEV